MLTLPLTIRSTLMHCLAEILLLADCAVDGRQGVAASSAGKRLWLRRERASEGLADEGKRHEQALQVC